MKVFGAIIYISTEYLKDRTRIQMAVPVRISGGPEMPIRDFVSNSIDSTRDLGMMKIKLKIGLSR